MTRKCIICGKDCEYVIKGTNDYYCKECAEDNFADLSYLQTAEDEAIALKEIIKERI